MTDAKRIQFYSASLTAVLWLLAAFAVFLIPLAPNAEKETYPVVKITLSTESSRQKNEQSQTEIAPQSQLQPVPAQAAPSASARQREVAQTPQARQSTAQPQERPQPRSQSPQAPSQVSPQSRPPARTPENLREESAPQALAPDLSTLSIAPVPAQSAPKKPAEWPSDAEWVTQTTKQAQTTAEVQTPQVPSSVPSAPAQFEGTAAAAAQSADTGSRVASAGRTSSAASSAVSGETTGALKRISEAIYSQQGGSAEISYETTLQAVAQSAAGGVEIQMRDGTTRRLLDPQEPKIILTAESEKLIDGSKRVMVQFRVLAAGTVPAGGITFSPAGLLPVPVQEEVRAQISRWRFETASSDGQAAFQYSIKKE